MINPATKSLLLAITIVAVVSVSYDRLPNDNASQTGRVLAIRNVTVIPGTGAETTLESDE